MMSPESALVWLWTNHRVVRLNQAQVLGAVDGLRAATLQTWANRGLILPVNPNPTKASVREYDFNGLLSIAVMHALVDFGITASTASDLAKRLPGSLRRGFRLAGKPFTPPNLRASLVAIGRQSGGSLEAAFFFDGDPLPVHTGIPAGAMMLIYPLGAEIERIAARLVELLGVTVADEAA